MDRAYHRTKAEVTLKLAWEDGTSEERRRDLLLTANTHALLAQVEEAAPEPEEGRLLV